MDPNDVMPIFICPLNKKENKVDEDLDEFGDQEIKTEVKKDLYQEVINKIKKSVSPAVINAINDCECFIRLWYDTEEKAYCDEITCDLRPFCEQGYHQVVGFKTAPEGVVRVVEEEKKKEVKKQGPKEYVDAGNPSDAFVKIIWEDLGSPPEIENYEYSKQTVLEDRWEAQQAFIFEFGNHLQLIRRSSYHMYFYKGIHLIRLWVNTKKGTWIDLHRDLAVPLGKNGFKTKKVPIIDRNHVYKKFVSRTKITSKKQAAKFAKHVLKHLHKVKLR